MTMPHLSRPHYRRIAIIVLAVAAAVSLWVALGSQARQLADAVRAMAVGPILIAFVLCVFHRIVNAHGWTMVLRGQGQTMSTSQGARIWLASEACRWLPGSVWSYGSRAVLATKAGVPPAIAAASLMWELILTILAWMIVAAVGVLCWQGPTPEALLRGLNSFAGHPWLSTLVLLGVALALGAFALKSASRRIARLATALKNFGRFGMRIRSFLCVLGFYLTMVLLNGATLLQVVHAEPVGFRCPFSVVVTANSIGWLAGLFALFAPGGLVVREASIVVLLSGWLPTEQALTVALAWRGLQIAAEITTYLAIGVFEAARYGRGRSRPGVPAKGIEA